MKYSQIACSRDDLISREVDSLEQGARRLRGGSHDGLAVW